MIGKQPDGCDDNYYRYYCYDHVAEIGTGLWTGIFFGISGGIGLLVFQRPSHCK